MWWEKLTIIEMWPKCFLEELKNKISVCSASFGIDAYIENGEYLLEKLFIVGSKFYEELALVITTHLKEMFY